MGNVRNFALIFALIPSVLTCETLPSSLHIIKEVYGAAGELMRTCEGEVAVNKCEGSCLSQVKPSALTSTGFNKECYCCMETGLRVRQVVLPKCYDPDGNTLTGDKETFVLSLKEPYDCKCMHCGEHLQNKR